MGSSARIGASRAVLVARLLAAWEKVPDNVSFGTLLGKALHMPTLIPESDEELAQLIERYVLLNAPSRS